MQIERLLLKGRLQKNVSRVRPRRAQEPDHGKTV
jgi:hypothetical protein